MISSGGAAPPPLERSGGVTCPAVSIGPPFSAPEHDILQRVLRNRLLDQIRHSDSQRQVRRITRLVGDLAAITSTLTMSLCDLLFRFMSGQEEHSVQRHHSTALQAVDIINATSFAAMGLLRRTLSSHRTTARRILRFWGLATMRHRPR